LHLECSTVTTTDVASLVCFACFAKPLRASRLRPFSIAIIAKERALIRSFTASYRPNDSKYDAMLCYNPLFRAENS
jgi:hypothetical protein